MSRPIIAVQDVKKSYRIGTREVAALDGVSLKIEQGEFLAVIGPSGAGKSTLLHIMGGLDRPTSGKVAIDGDDIYKKPDGERAGIRNLKIGFIFQFYNLLPDLTALENVMLPAMMDRRKCRAEASGILESVGLSHRAGHYPRQLSGGEAQRIAIARAIMNSPQALLCDEPTGNLDSKTSESILELLLGLKKSHGTALVVVTHEERISKSADQVVRIKDGCLA